MKRLLAFAGVLLALALAFAGWFVKRVALDRDLPRADTAVVVPAGSTGRDVARLLAAHGVIASARAFELLARFRGASASMKAGEFRFPAHESMVDVLDAVRSGGRQIAVWVTIPEGFTAREIAHTLSDRGLGSERSFDVTFFGTRLRIGGVATPNLEGYLFPETYLVPVGATPDAIAALMTDQFRHELPRDASAVARRDGLSIPQIVTLASLVEREAKADDERALMAGVYYNRLRRNMPLQVDATIEYTFAHHKDVITFADLARDSPYNTYRRTGLPPTPIANPGRASLLAAFRPQPSGYLYYVYAGNGHHVFSRTLAEHNANVARYLH